MEQLTLTSQVKKETLGQKASSWKHRSVATARYTGKQLAWFVRLGGILVVTLLWGSAWVVNVRAEDRLAEALQMCVSKHPYVTKTVEIVTGATFSTLMEGAEVSGMDILAILTVADNVYNLSSIRLGRNLELRYKRESGELVGLEYQIDTEEMLYVTKDEDGWQAERKLIEYEVRLRTVEGAIESSLYIAALEQGLDDRAVVALADVFQWELDFSMDVQQGDGFKFIYEERFLAGRYIMPGRVLAAKFINSGESHYAFLFETTPGKEAHFNEQGESVQKMFLKAPVAFKYISSGFTTGLRYVE
ncbi:hypothetical protein KKE28_03350, partial [Patescibacteria group bacterium]|nr:hypothetical protein [Patescibacteria group bacterium]